MNRFPFLCAVVGLLLVSPARAESPAKRAPAATSAAAPSAAVADPSSPAANAADEPMGGIEALPPGFKVGPQDLDLGEGLTLAIPKEHGFFDATRAKEMLRKGGNKDVDGVLGAVIPLSESAKWAVILRFAGDGYIKDEESLDAKEIFEAIQEGTEEMNELRKEQNIPALFVDGWFEEPRYEREKHHMVWGLNGHTVEDGPFVNYNTHVLGRKGYVSLNLVSEPATLAQDKLEVATLLANTRFKEGERYEDFKEGTDKVAEYGLAGLVLGGAGLGAAKLVKLGILAKFGKVILGVLIAGKKAVVAVVVAIAAILRKIVGMRSSKSAEPQPPAEP
jgi:uncharacterized membrane-anchored protein